MRLEKPAITKTRHYVWRVNARFHVEHFAYIDAWNVIAVGGEMLHGGHESGNNTRSGRATCPTKSQARAFVAGWGYAQEYEFTDAQEDRTKIHEASQRWVKENRIGLNLRSICSTWFENAVWQWINRQEWAKRKELAEASHGG